MKNRLVLGLALLLIGYQSIGQPSFEEITDYSKIENLVSNNTRNIFGWLGNYHGERNIFIAQAPLYKPIQKTFFTEKEELEISGLQITEDAHFAVFVRGGDHGGYLYKTPSNTLSLPENPDISIWSISLIDNSKAKQLTVGDNISLSPDNKNIAYIKNGEIWQIPIVGGNSKRLLHDIGKCNNLQWSSDGKHLAFVSNREGHSFIGIYTDSITPIKWISPSFFQDNSPRWSDDGGKIAFIRTINIRSDRDSILVRQPDIWEIWVYDFSSKKSQRLYQAPFTLQGGTEPNTSNGFNLKWMSDNYLSFLSYQDGWPHLYTISIQGGKAKCLTPGNYMVEHPSLTKDKHSIVFDANSGKDSLDIDRRHIMKVDLNGKLTTITQGDGIEAYPQSIGNNGDIVCIASTSTTAPIPALITNQKIIPIIVQPNEIINKDLVIPQQILFHSPDGIQVHAQLFLPKNYKGKIPAVVFVHGGPDRQMYLGWHYNSYYANCYALNQYLATHGIAVISVNYRCGIGYGFAFDEPENSYSHGAMEYTDIKAAGEWLKKQSYINTKKIGIYGGSYGGYLTALALSKNSDIFSAGVDIHGVHEHEKEETNYKNSNAPDALLALAIEKTSFAINDVSNWRSPVLLIHGDDDRNVDFGQSIDLAKELLKYKIPFEYLVIPNDTHHWMKYANEQNVDKATLEFLERKLK